MAPKPFDPPLSNGRPKSTFTNKTTLSTSQDSLRASTRIKVVRSRNGSSNTNKRTTSSTSNAKKITTPANKRTKFNRTGSASTLRLPSLSPGTSDGESENASDEEIEDSDESSNAEDNTRTENLASDDLIDNDNTDFSHIDDNTSTNGMSNDPFGSDLEISRRRPGDHSRRRDEDNDKNESESSSEQDIFISRDLVSVLLNEMFKHGNSASHAKNNTTDDMPREGQGFVRREAEKGQTRMTKQAVGAVAKYLDTFVRETVARAAWEGIERGGTGVLEVEDLERLAPQLVLDF